MPFAESHQIIIRLHGVAQEIGEPQGLLPPASSSVEQQDPESRHACHDQHAQHAAG
jgi:hypothetical protein